MKLKTNYLRIFHLPSTNIWLQAYYMTCSNSDACAQVTTNRLLLYCQQCWMMLHLGTLDEFRVRFLKSPAGHVFSIKRCVSEHLGLSCTPFSLQTFLTQQSRKSTGVICNINDGFITLRWAGSGALVLCILSHCDNLLRHVIGPSKEWLASQTCRRESTSY